MFPVKRAASTEAEIYIPSAHFHPNSITAATDNIPAKHGKAYVPKVENEDSSIITTSSAAITEQNASLKAGFDLVFFFIAVNQQPLKQLHRQSAHIMH